MTHVDQDLLSNNETIASNQAEQPSTPQERNPGAPNGDSPTSGPPISSAFLAEVTQEYQQTGSLSDERYEQLEKLGIGKPFVDTYMNGLRAQITEAQNKAYEAVGGKDAYTDMQQWAMKSLKPEQIDAFNEAVNSSNFNTVLLAIKGLHAEFAKSQEPRLMGGVSASGVNSFGTSAFESIAQVTEAIKDPRYEKDPAYRKSVMDKLARSSIL